MSNNNVQDEMKTVNIETGHKQEVAAAKAASTVSMSDERREAAARRAAMPAKDLRHGIG